jgi:hypothetical protein
MALATINLQPYEAHRAAGRGQGDYIVKIHEFVFREYSEQLLHSVLLMLRHPQPQTQYSHTEGLLPCVC